MSAFMANPQPATAQLVANIYKESGLDDRALKWYPEADFIEGAADEKITQAHILGLPELARASAAEQENGTTKGSNFLLIRKVTALNANVVPRNPGRASLRAVFVPSQIGVDQSHGITSVPYTCRPPDTAKPFSNQKPVRPT